MQYTLTLSRWHKVAERIVIQQRHRSHGRQKPIVKQDSARAVERETVTRICILWNFDAGKTSSPRKTNV